MSIWSDWAIAGIDKTVTPALGAGQQFGQPIGFHDITSVLGGEL